MILISNILVKIYQILFLKNGESEYFLRKIG